MSEKSIIYQKEIPIKIHCDILVVGGSQSGVAAAVCAKRANPEASVHLIEQMGTLGGQSVTCMVCHYEFREYTNNKGQVVAKGIGKEMIKRIVAKGHSDPLYQEWLDGRGPPFKDVADGRAFGDIPLDIEDIRITLLEMCDEADVKIHYFTKLLDIKNTNEKGDFIAPEVAIVTNFYEIYGIQAQIIVDCSANNDVAWKIDKNAVTIPEKKKMSMQTYAWLGGVDFEKFLDDFWDKRKWWQMAYPNDKEQMYEHMRQGKAIVIKGGLGYFEAAEEKYEGIFDKLEELRNLNIYFWLKPIKIFPHKIGDNYKYDSLWAIEGPVSHDDQTDPDIVNQFMQDQLKAVHLLRDVHSVMPGWENCYVAKTAETMGLRQTRVLKGLYSMTKEDIMEGKKHNDVIGRAGGHDISRDNPQVEYGYDIPYRALIPAQIDGLLVGARSISCETDDPLLIALNAHRGISTTIIVSQAAGVAAALCIKDNVQPRKVDIKELQNVLKQQDVVLEAPPKENK